MLRTAISSAVVMLFIGSQAGASGPAGRRQSRLRKDLNTSVFRIGFLSEHNQLTRATKASALTILPAIP